MKSWLRKRKLHKKKETIIKLKEEKYHHEQMIDWLVYKIAEAEQELAILEAPNREKDIITMPTLKQAGVIIR